MSREAIRKVLEAKASQPQAAPSPEAGAENGAAAEAPQKQPAPAATEESVHADKRLDEGAEVEKAPNADPDAGDGDGNDPDPTETDDPNAEHAEGDSEEDRRKTRIEKRINKEIHKRKKAESELEAAQARIQELEAQANQPGASGPALAKEYSTPEQVEARRLEIRNQLRTVNKYIREGGFTDDESGDTIQVEELERMAADLEDERDIALPQVAERLRERERIDRDQVAKLYPDLLDEHSDAYEEAEALLQDMPFLRTHPEGRLWVGRMLKGKRMERLPAKQAPGPGKPTKTPAPPREPVSEGAAVRTSVTPPESANSQQELVSRLRQRMLSKINS